MCGSLSITTPGSNLANEFDVRSELHGQVSLAAVNQNLCRFFFFFFFFFFGGGGVGGVALSICG